jgi:hypothetical protein
LLIEEKDLNAERLRGVDPLPQKGGEPHLIASFDGIVRTHLPDDEIRPVCHKGCLKASDGVGNRLSCLSGILHDDCRLPDPG